MPVGTTGALLAGRYRVRQRLGSGGMATVFLAKDERLGRMVAVKRLHADSAEDVAQRFQREAKLGASLNHPNIVAVYDTEAEAEGVLIIMEYVDGETLREEIGRGPLEPARALEVLTGVAAALDHAHDHGVVHRDVKPANVLLSATGAVKLADLGIATAAERTQITLSGTVLGTAAYMAPERLDGHAGGPEVDVYALAAVAFEALSGQKAVTGKTALEVARRVISQPPPDLVRVVAGSPLGAASALRRGLSKEPTERQHSAGELVRQLKRAYGPAVRRRPVAVESVQKPEIALPKVDSAAEAEALRPDEAPRPKEVAEPPAAARELASHAQAEPVAKAPDPAPAPVVARVPSPAVADSTTPAARGDRATDTGGTTAAERGRSRPAVAAPARVARGDHQTHRGSRRWIIPAALAAAACVAIALVVALGSGGSPTGSASRATASGATASKPATAGHNGAAASPQGASPGSSATAPPGGASSASVPLNPSTPQGAVNSFYTLPTKGDFNGGWALGTSALHAQVKGFDSWKRGESDLKSITFPTLRVTRQTGSSATVALVSAANHGAYTDHCTGTVDMIRSGSTWMLEQLHISDCPRTSNSSSR